MNTGELFAGNNTPGTEKNDYIRSNLFEMNPDLLNTDYVFLLGDCLTVLRDIDSESIDCVITSPPYWAMRIYDNAENVNEVGNEDDYRDYVKKLTEVFREVKRVLKKSGSLWLNLGDKYNDKALMGIPWRVALSLMDDGWILRNDVIWSQMKGTQSCKDRLRDSYEHVFHFVKSKKYYYDDEAIRIKPTLKPIVNENTTISATGVSGKKYRSQIVNSTVLSEEEKQNALDALEETLDKIRRGEVNDFRMTIRGCQRPWHSDNTKVSGRAKELEEKGFYIMNIGAKGALPTDIWNIVPEDTWRKDSHFAVFPEELLRIPILATCPKGGWVLDPFSGSGSTVSAALKLERKGIGIDLSQEYNAIAEKRIAALTNYQLLR
ncbi:MAG: DNA-methyltransferase [Candidatus Cryptobacteroides sp.]